MVGSSIAYIHPIGTISSKIQRCPINSCSDICQHHRDFHCTGKMYMRQSDVDDFAHAIWKAETQRGRPSDGFRNEDEERALAYFRQIAKGSQMKVYIIPDADYTRLTTHERELPRRLFETPDNTPKYISVKELEAATC
ncbi:MAG: hypothetical protein ABIA21_00410 [Candidatus Aenigmatarchaeota archaeon]